MDAVPKGNGTTFVLRRTDILIEEINKEKWRLNYLLQISSRTLEKANVLVQTQTIEIHWLFETQVTKCMGRLALCLYSVGV